MLKVLVLILFHSIQQVELSRLYFTDIKLTLNPNEIHFEPPPQTCYESFDVLMCSDPFKFASL